MNNFKLWYFRNQEKISWFFTGWLSLGCINSLGRGDYVSAAISAGLIMLNVSLSR